ncbi:MAG: cytidine deaminase [Lachnospiraceae bacterium]|nr:cytidine deaminase [Lachnospiraceae bacterium]
MRTAAQLADDTELIKQAYEAQKYAYAPYSHFAVGAALETEDGQVFLGCNIENASYTPTNCAERTAFFKAVSEGHRSFRRIAIVGGYLSSCGSSPGQADYCAPCGVCRQVMAEFCDPDTFRILLAKNPREYRSYMLRELLPLSFGPGNLYQKDTF